MKYYTDGWMMGSKNPSPYGGAYTITDDKGNIIKEEEIRKVGFTNNEADIWGILNALKYAKEGDIISTDSMCCLTWANAGKSKARPDLKEILDECRQLKENKSINLWWEAREFNLAGIYNEENRDEKTRFRIEMGIQENLLKNIQ